MRQVALIFGVVAVFWLAFFTRSRFASLLLPGCALRYTD